MSDDLAKNKAPSFVLYIISTHILYLAITFLPIYFGTFSSFGCFAVCTTNAEAIRATSNANMLFLATFLSIIEFSSLRKSFGKLAFGTSFIIELVKLYTLATQLISIDNTFLVALSGASLLSVFFSKVFYTKVTDITKNPLTQNLSQIIPALVVIVLFTGSSLLSTIGLAPVSQEPNPQNFSVNYRASMFKTPSWNAQYFLDNILDQFTAGLLNPNLVVFNVTNLTPDPSDSPSASPSPNQLPLAYYRENSYFNYAYDSKIATSGTFMKLTPGQNVLHTYTPGGVSNVLSNPVPDSYLQYLQTPKDQRNYTVYTLQFTKEINLTSSYTETLPVIWNSKTYENTEFYGSFIDPNSVEIANLDGTPLTSCASPVAGQGPTKCTYFEDSLPFQNFQVISDAGLQITGLPNTGAKALLKYKMNYLVPNVQKLQAYAQPRSYYSTVFDANTLSAINSYYKELPNHADGTLPAAFPNGTIIDTYGNWSPLLYKYAQEYNNSQINVLQQALADMNALAPNGPLNLTFDTSMYKSEITGTGPHPDAGEDYVQWFLTNKAGVSAHFATALTLMLRFQGIPARFVTGFAMGNSSYDPTHVQNVVTALYNWAWTEVLVPLDTPAGPSYEWVPVDPVAGPALGYYAAGSFTPNSNTNNTGSYIRRLLLDPNTYDPSIPLGTPASTANINQAIFRIGVLPNSSTISASTHSSQSPVNLSVFVADVTFENNTPTTIVGAGDVPVTFQATSYDNVLNKTVAKPWSSNNLTQTSFTVKTDKATDIANATFYYQPFFANWTAVHSTGPVVFVAKLNASSSQWNAASDSNRSDDTFDYLTNTGQVNPDPYQTEFTGALLNSLSTNKISQLTIKNMAGESITVPLKRSQINEPLIQTQTQMTTTKIDELVIVIPSIICIPLVINKIKKNKYQNLKYYLIYSIQ